MKPATILVILLVAGGVVAWRVAAIADEGRTTDSAAGETSRLRDRNERIAPTALTTGTAHPRNADVARHGRTKQVLSKELAGSDTRLVALSVEEAQWLDKHGYPTLAELERLDSYSEAALLEAARERGVPKAAVLLGLKRMHAGDDSGALAAFSLGASNGSLYARQAGALMSLTRTAQYPGGMNDDQKAVTIAALEVTRMLGDHRVGGLIDRLDAEISRRFYGEAIRLGMIEFMRQYTADFSSRNLPAPGPDPRPNAAEWARIDAGTDPDRMITIVDRGGG